MKLKVKIGLIVIFNIILSALFGKNMTYTVQKLLAQNIANVSSILFGVLGLWAGLLAPDGVRKVNNPNEKIENRKSAWKELDYIFRPIFVSLGILSLSMGFIFIGEILNSIQYLKQYFFIFRSIGFFITMLLSSATAWLIFSSFKPGAKMLYMSKTGIRKRETYDRNFRSNEL